METVTQSTFSSSLIQQLSEVVENISLFILIALLTIYLIAIIKFYKTTTEGIEMLWYFISSTFDFFCNFINGNQLSTNINQQVLPTNNNEGSATKSKTQQEQDLFKSNSLQNLFKSCNNNYSCFRALIVCDCYPLQNDFRTNIEEKLNQFSKGEKKIFCKVDILNEATITPSILDNYDILFTTLGCGDKLSEESLQKIKLLLEKDKIVLCILRGFNKNSIPYRLGFTKDYYIDFTMGNNFELNYKIFYEFLKLEKNNFYLNQFKHKYFDNNNESTKNVTLSEDGYITGLKESSLVEREKWFILGASSESLEDNLLTVNDSSNKSEKTCNLLIHKELKVIFPHWYGCANGNEFSNDLLRSLLQFMLIEYDPRNRKKMINQFIGNLVLSVKENKCTDIAFVF
ncbi:hypothetical protein ABK040_013370 [Willaertia magna]